MSNQSRNEVEAGQIAAPASVNAAAPIEQRNGARLVPIESVVEDKELADLVPRSQDTIDALAEDMRIRRFDPAHPLKLTKDGNLADGYTRLYAAKLAGLTHVWVIDEEFESQEALKLYVIRSAMVRRNLNDIGFLALVPQYVDLYKDSEDWTSTSKAKGRKKVELAAVVGKDLGIGKTKVYEILHVHQHGSDDMKSKVLAGEISIHAACEQSKAAVKPRKEPKPAASSKAAGVAQDPVSSDTGRTRPRPVSGETGTVPPQTTDNGVVGQVVAPERVCQSDCHRFQYTNDMVGWAKCTWNPVTGCSMGCEYCYARTMALRFTNAYPNGFEPTPHEDALQVPSTVPPDMLKVPGGNMVFVSSMGDLFGEWVPQEWIDKVLAVVRANPQWIFVFLTKNPARLATIQWPPNTVVGATIDTQARVEASFRAFRAINCACKAGAAPKALFISCEPMLERIDFAFDSEDGRLDLKTCSVDWLMLGARSRVGKLPEMQPDPEWLAHAIRQARQAGTTIFLKENLNLKAWPENLMPEKARKSGAAEGTEETSAESIETHNAA